MPNNPNSTTNFRNFSETFLKLFVLLGKKSICEFSIVVIIITIYIYIYQQIKIVITKIIIERFYNGLVKI